MCTGDVGFSLDRVAKAEAVARNPKLQAAVDFAGTCQLKADAQSGQCGDHRASRIGFHCVVDTGLWQQGLERRTALPHRLEIDDYAGRRECLPSQVLIDPFHSVHCGTGGPVGRDL